MSERIYDSAAIPGTIVIFGRVISAVCFVGHVDFEAFTGHCMIKFSDALTSKIAPPESPMDIFLRPIAEKRTESAYKAETKVNVVHSADTIIGLSQCGIAQQLFWMRRQILKMG